MSIPQLLMIHDRLGNSLVDDVGDLSPAARIARTDCPAVSAPRVLCARMTQSGEGNEIRFEVGPIVVVKSGMLCCWAMCIEAESAVETPRFTHGFVSSDWSCAERDARAAPTGEPRTLTGAYMRCSESGTASRTVIR